MDNSQGNWLQCPLLLYSEIKITVWTKTRLSPMEQSDQGPNRLSETYICCASKQKYAAGCISRQDFQIYFLAVKSLKKYIPYLLLYVERK